MTDWTAEEERVARALAKADGWELPEDMSLPFAPGSRIGKTMLAARAAISAMHPHWRVLKTNPPPKDGTVFIALQDGDVYLCQWHEQVEYEDYRCGWWDIVNESIEDPTHWMPLPPAPEAHDEGR